MGPDVKRSRSPGYLKGVGTHVDSTAYVFQFYFIIVVRPLTSSQNKQRITDRHFESLLLSSTQA